MNRLPHTVSGISAGVFMAVQHHVVYSNDVDGLDGVSAIAGGPFWCANANAITAQTACMKAPALIDVAELEIITHTTFCHRLHRQPGQPERRPRFTHTTRGLHLEPPRTVTQG